MRLALTAPRFDATDVEINRAQILSMLRRATTSPTDIASLRWWQTAFADHPYGRPVGRHAGNGARDHRRRSQRLHAAGAGASQPESRRSSATSTPKRQRRCSTACSARFRRKPELKPVANISPQGLGKPRRHQARCAAGGGDIRRPRQARRSTTQRPLELRRRFPARAKLDGPAPGQRRVAQRGGLDRRPPRRGRRAGRGPRSRRSRRIAASMRAWMALGRRCPGIACSTARRVISCRNRSAVASATSRPASASSSTTPGGVAAARSSSDGSIVAPISAAVQSTSRAVARAGWRGPIPRPGRPGHPIQPGSEHFHEVKDDMLRLP